MYHHHPKKYHSNNKLGKPAKLSSPLPIMLRTVLFVWIHYEVQEKAKELNEKDAVVVILHLRPTNDDRKCGSG